MLELPFENHRREFDRDAIHRNHQNATCISKCQEILENEATQRKRGEYTLSVGFHMRTDDIIGGGDGWGGEKGKGSLSVCAYICVIYLLTGVAPRSLVAKRWALNKDKMF